MLFSGYSWRREDELLPNLDVTILAAGIGRRFSRDPAVLKQWYHLGGISIVERILIEALRLDPEHVFIVGDAERGAEIIEYPEVKFLEPKGNYLADLFSAVQASEADHLIVINGDAALVKSESLAEFLSIAQSCDVGFVWPGVPKESCYPEKEGFRFIPGNRTLVRGNVMYFRPEIVFMDEVVFTRMCAFPAFAEVIALGGIGAIKCLLGWLKPDELCTIMGRGLGCQAKIVAVDLPDLVFDIDTPTDLLKAQQVLEREDRLFGGPDLDIVLSIML